MLIFLFFPVVQDEHKFTQSARFELAREDPIWFLVRRLNHSAMTACGLLDSSKSLLMFSVFCRLKSVYLSIKMSIKTQQHSNAEVHVDFFSVFLYSCRSRWACSSKIRSQQDSNLRGKIPSDFESDALTTRPWLLADFSILISLFWCFLSSICFPVD